MAHEYPLSGIIYHVIAFMLLGDGAVVEPNPDLMAALLAAATAHEAAAHLVNSVGSATGRAARQLLAEWQGRGAEGFANQVSYLATATPDAAEKLLAVATALRILAPAISQAQALARQATTIREHAAPLAAALRDTTLGAIRVQAATDDLTAADTMTSRANAMGQDAWNTATRAFNAISTASTETHTATLTSLTDSRPAQQPHDQRPKVTPDQVKLITEADGQRVYSFDGGLKIPADMPGAQPLVEGIKAYLPRYLAGHTGDIEIPAGLSAQHTWYEVAYLYIITHQGTVPRQIRDQFFTDTYSSITFKTAAGMSVLGAAGSITPAAGDNSVTGEQITQTNQGLGTGTVWDSITPTQEEYEGTVLPKSFVMEVDGEDKVWVAPNATKHILDRVKIVSAQSQPIEAQNMLSSLRAAVKAANDRGNILGRMTEIGDWDLKFGAPQPGEPYPELYHALYRG